MCCEQIDFTQAPFPSARVDESLKNVARDSSASCIQPTAPYYGTASWKLDVELPNWEGSAVHSGRRNVVALLPVVALTVGKSA